MPVEFIFNDFQFLWQLELIIKQLITIQQELFDRLRYNTTPNLHTYTPKQSKFNLLSPAQSHILSSFIDKCLKELFHLLC